MRRHRGGADFTHFASLPFIDKNIRQNLRSLQDIINNSFAKKHFNQYLTRNNVNLFHLTLSMLTLPHKSQQEKVKKILDENKKIIYEELAGSELTMTQLGYFTRKSH